MSQTQAKPASKQQQVPQGNGSKPAVQETGSDLFEKLLRQEHRWTALGEDEEMVLTPWHVQNFLAVPTRKGIKPTTPDCVKFCIMCRQRKLNPWAGDCYMIGYDSSKPEEPPKFSVVTAIQALLARAELNAAFDGIESGVVVRFTDLEGNQVIEERQGDLIYVGETNLGGWCKVYRRDRSKPFYQRLKRETYDKGTPQWRQDGPGMICKCSEAAALRQAFPSVIGGLYLKDEIEAFIGSPERKAANTEGAVTLDVLSGKTPARTMAPSQSSGSADGAGGSPEGIDPPSPDEPSEQVDDPSGDGYGEDVELQLTNWQHDVETTGTNGKLDQLAEEAAIAPASIRGKVLEMIGKRRAALKGGKGNGGNLPGVG